jgi:tetratricopeptide (TPR) repeat protein
MYPRKSPGTRSVLAAVICVGHVGAWSERAHAQPVAPEPQTLAREAYASGVVAFQSGDYAQALAQFTTANAAFPSPNVKLMLGRALQQLGRRPAAYEAFQAAVRDANGGDITRYEQAANAAKEALQQLEAALAVIRVRIVDPSGEATLRVGNQEIARDGWSEPIAADPGAIEIALVGPDGQRDVKHLEMSAGTAATLSMALAERAQAGSSEPAVAVRPSVRPTAAVVTEADRRQQLRMFSYVAAGIGTGGIVAFGVLGAMSNAQFSQLDAGCPNRSACSPSLEAHATRGQAYQTLANVSLGIGLTALAAGVVLWVVGLPSEHSQVAVTARGVQLSGSF